MNDLTTEQLATVRRQAEKHEGAYCDEVIVLIDEVERRRAEDAERSAVELQRTDPVAAAKRTFLEVQKSDFAGLSDQQLAETLERIEKDDTGWWAADILKAAIKREQHMRAANAANERGQQQSREVTYHRCEGNVLNDGLQIVPLGFPGPGNAFVCYDIVFAKKVGDQSYHMHHIEIPFQHGDPREQIKGASNEALLAIVQHRLEGFQSGPFACYENAVVLDHVKIALSWSHARTKNRLERGVEGQAVK